MEVRVGTGLELPHVAVALSKGEQKQRNESVMSDERERKAKTRLTLLFPATSIDPSDAIVTERIGTSASGTYADTQIRSVSRVSSHPVDNDALCSASVLTSSCVHVFSARSHTLTLPS